MFESPKKSASPAVPIAQRAPTALPIKQPMPATGPMPAGLPPSAPALMNRPAPPASPMGTAQGERPAASAISQALGHWADPPSASRSATGVPGGGAATLAKFAAGGPMPGRAPFPRGGGEGGDPACQGPPELGTLSARYESNGDPGTVSTGNGDIGGVSYGSYQMSTASGSAGQFVSNSPYANDFAGLQPGTSAFSDKWREIASRDPAGFQAAQHEYIKENYYDVESSRLKEDMGLDPNQHSNALQQVIWSTSVQHGAYSSIVQDALAGQDLGKLSDTDMINAIYAERGRTDENGNLVHFGGSSYDVQQGVAGRFRNENADALNMLQAEQQCPAPQSP